MDNWTKTKEWVNEHAPMLSAVYQNKYVGMMYDRFASLPPKQQKQVILGCFFGLVTIIVGYLGLSYFSLWYSADRTSGDEAMINMLQQYQKQRRDKGSQIQNLELNNRLAGQGQFKQQLLEDGKNAGVSSRMMQVEEKPESEEAGEDGKSGHDVKIKQATVSMQRVNLSQLKNFLNNIEFGPYNLSVSSIKITNDNKIRGYMNVDLGVVAYLFQAETGE